MFTIRHTGHAQGRAPTSSHPSGSGTVDIRSKVLQHMKTVGHPTATVCRLGRASARPGTEDPAGRIELKAILRHHSYSQKGTKGRAAEVSYQALVCPDSSYGSHLDTHFPDLLPSPLTPHFYHVLLILFPCNPPALASEYQTFAQLGIAWVPVCHQAVTGKNQSVVPCLPFH